MSRLVWVKFVVRASALILALIGRLSRQKLVLTLVRKGAKAPTIIMPVGYKHKILEAHSMWDIL